MHPVAGQGWYTKLFFKKQNNNTRLKEGRIAGDIDCSILRHSWGLSWKQEQKLNPLYDATEQEVRIMGRWHGMHMYTYVLIAHTCFSDVNTVMMQRVMMLLYLIAINKAVTI